MTNKLKKVIGIVASICMAIVFLPLSSLAVNAAVQVLSASSDIDIPQTGDSSPVLAIIASILVVIGIVLFLVYLRIRKKKM